MNIGYGSVSAYDSIKHTLYYNNNTNIAYFCDKQQKYYYIKLDTRTKNYVNQNKKIDITLTQMPPSNLPIKFTPTIDYMNA